MKKLILFLILTSCNPRNDMENYTCSQDQLNILERQKKLCSQKTEGGMQYNDSFCFKISMMSSCSYKGPE